MVTRCPPCGVERIGSRSPGALGLFWGTESTAPGRSSPRPRTASPYPTMWSLPSVRFSFVFRFFCFFLVFLVFAYRIIRSVFYFFRSFVPVAVYRFRFFFCVFAFLRFRRGRESHSAERDVKGWSGGRGHTHVAQARRMCGKSTGNRTWRQPDIREIFVQSVRKKRRGDRRERNRRDQ